MKTSLALILTRAALMRDYHKLKLRATEIARKYNTTSTTVYFYMKKHKIPARSLINDIKGRKFGQLIVLKFSHMNKKGKACWICKCKCGKKRTIVGGSLLAGLTKSCGCLNANKNRTGYKDISGSYWRRLIKSAGSRNIKFSIEPKYVWQIYERQHRKCALTGVQIAFYVNSNKPQYNTASVDRIDSNKGYIVGNIQIVHKAINRSKSWFKQNEFIAMSNLVAKMHPMGEKSCLKNFFNGLLLKSSRALAASKKESK